MKKRFSFIVTYGILLLLGVLGAAVLFGGDREGGVSEKENRTLQGLPAMTLGSVAGGSFSMEMEQYLSDQMFGREELLDASAAVMGLFSRVTAAEALMLVDMDALIAEEAGGTGDYAVDDPLTEPAPDGEEQPDAAAAPDAEEAGETPEHAESGLYTFSFRNTGGGFSRIYAFSDESIAATAHTLNTYRAALPENGNVFFTYVPYSQVACEWLLHPEDYCGWVSDAEAVIQELVDPGVYVYSSVNTLEPHMRDGEPVYFMTDHHWAPLGAYYMTEQMVEGTGVPSARYYDYDYYVHQEFIGSIYAQMKKTTKEDLSEQLDLMYPLAPARAYRYRLLGDWEKELPFMEYSRSAYGALLGGSHKPWHLIETGFHTGRSALVIGDSFANAFAPYLTPYYDTVCLCDLRKSSFFGRGAASVREYIRYFGIDDVYFVVTTGTGINSGYMKERVLEALG